MALQEVEARLPNLAHVDFDRDGSGDWSGERGGAGWLGIGRRGLRALFLMSFLQLSRQYGLAEMVL